MAKLEDPEQLAQILKALRNRRHYVDWKRVPAEWLRKNLEGQTTQSIDAAMLAHAEAGGRIERREERRTEYRERFEFYFEFILTIDGHKIYIEFTLEESILPVVTIVSMHYENRP